MDTQDRYTDATIQTADDLRTVARSISVRELSRLSLPEIDAVVEQISRVMPAGNVPGVILNGLARLSNRKLPLGTIKRDIDLLFRGVEQALDRAAYGMFFAGPAAIIWGYQNLLKLAGKKPEDAFPEGTWQFYVDYALREDTARHTNESHGFDTLLNFHQIQLGQIDRITAWTMAAIYTLHQYDDLLANEWRERVYTALLREISRNQPEADRYAGLYREWEKQRPYKRSSDVEATESFPAYRQRKFNDFLETATQALSPNLYDLWTKQIETAEARDLPAYQQQMSILAYLDPGAYGETRIPTPLSQAHVGLIYQGHYYLIPACVRNSEDPIDVVQVRQQVATLLAAPVGDLTASLTPLAEMKRTELVKFLNKLDRATASNLENLHLTPILFNCDPRPAHLPLVDLRQTERGFGHHALTLFDTGETIVFDQSHIFFDGAWGAALAEIMTNEALSWAVYLNTLHPPQTGETRPYAVMVHFQPDEQTFIQRAPRATPETTAETTAVDLDAILALRKRFKQRNDLLQLTVNDLLILYRAVHAATYRPDPDLIQALQSLQEQGPAQQKAAQIALAALKGGSQVNPTIVIPVDASQRIPRDRIYPMTFEAPLDDLNLLSLHKRTVKSLQAYQNARGDDQTRLYADFDRYQREYLATLAGFGVVMQKTKEVALLGESASVGTIKLLAHFPPSFQRMLDNIPSSFDVLNDIIKGREVFSNLGVVAPSSTLTRFITAKDDNDQKTLAWGVITDAAGVMHISLRDFRPHVNLLTACGYREVATQITQHYLDAYVQGLNNFIADLHEVTTASREAKAMGRKQEAGSRKE